MVRVKFGENFIIPEPTDINDHVESHIWLPLVMAKDVARHLINMGAFFTYLPDPGDDNTVEIIAFDDDLDKILIIDVEVRQ
jgi:hypothetical protein